MGRSFPELICSDVLKKRKQMFCRYVSTNQQLHKGIFNFLVGKHNKADDYVTMCFGKNYLVYILSKWIIVIFIS